MTYRNQLINLGYEAEVVDAMTEEQQELWIEMNADREREEEDNEPAYNCLCRGANACLQCNPSMFI
jgi:hypothetical protein